MAARNKWIAYRRESTGDRAIRLFFFPYAGKGASGYRELADRLADDLEPVLVQTPGREARLAEPAAAVMDDLVAALAVELGPLLTEPFAFFGHSMGSLVAFELARKLSTEAPGRPGPVHLFVSAELAPHLIRPPVVTNDSMTDAEFLADPARVRPGNPLLTDPMFAELMLRSDENRWSRCSSNTSAWRVSTQKPGLPPAPACRYTGRSSRSRRHNGDRSYSACVRGSTRSIPARSSTTTGARPSPGTVERSDVIASIPRATRCAQ